MEQEMKAQLLHERALFPDVDHAPSRVRDLELRVGELEEDKIEVDQLWLAVWILSVVVGVTFGVAIGTWIVAAA